MDTHLTATDLQSASNTVITVSVNQITAKELGMGYNPVVSLPERLKPEDL